MTTQSLRIFDNLRNVSSSGAQDKKSTNCALNQKCLVLGTVLSCRVWLKLKLVGHLAEQARVLSSAKMAYFLKINARLDYKSVKQFPKAGIQYVMNTYNNAVSRSVNNLATQ